jgi:diguanylate cyclase (GGDEF)-like protein
MKFSRLIASALFAFAALSLAYAAPRPGSEPQVDFGKPDNVIDLTPALSSYHAPGGHEADNSVWYILNVANSSQHAASRVLLAGQPPRAALHVLPLRMRPAIMAVVADSGATVETASGYGRRAWRVIVPPVTSVSLALRVATAQTPAALYAWTEPALASHNRQLAIFITAVGTLIAGAALITGGLAVLIGHAAPRWVAITLFFLLWAWLAGTGMFDASLATRIGGPYGLSAFLTALALAAGARLADAIIPIREIWPTREKLFHRCLYGLIFLGLAAYLGLPGATVVTDILIVLGSLVVAAYLVYCGRRGVKAAQVVAPSAAAFALVALAAAVTALGGLGENLTGPAATGGFAAAGAILLALAVIASEEIAVLPFLHGSNAARLLEARAPGAIDHTAPIANLALAAIGASHQGVFDLDFRADLLTLSPEGTQMAGFGTRTTIAHGDWVAQIHPEDRDIYVQALEQYRDQPGFAFRLEFRCRAPGGAFRWLELRATIVTEQNVPSDCLGLLSDIDQRKQAEIAASLPHDPLTGLGNRVALMEQLDTLGNDFAGALFVLLDIDRFKAIHASLGDAGADLVLQQMARRLEVFGQAEGGRLFRVGGDSFALLFAVPRRATPAYGDALLEISSQPFVLEGREVFAPTSIGLSGGAESGEPIALIANAELAMNAAKRLGGAAARVYSPELQNTAPADSVALESELRHALRAGHLDVWYQPIVRLADRSIAGFEALLRWNHPEKGVIEPAEFIGHSEETGLILQLGHFALERAAEDLARWQRYFPLRPPLFVSVNLSRRQLRDFRFESALKQVLATNELVPGTLNLEITESAVASSGDLPRMLERLRAAGAGLSIDDFGTGTSSLSQFRQLPFDTVKIDRSFLARHGGTDIDADGEVVLTSIIGLAHDLKRSVVVEGVENEADAKWLAELGCEFGQGFHFASAMNAAQAMDYIARYYDLEAAPRDGTG